MKQIPDIPDLEEVSRACDKLIAYMRNHPDPEAVKAVSTLCHFFTRVKDNVTWLETMVKTFKKVPKKTD